LAGCAGLSGDSVQDEAGQGLNMSQLPAQEELPKFSAETARDGMPHGWNFYRIAPFKKNTVYRLENYQGKTVLSANSKTSASGLAIKLKPRQAANLLLQWEWKAINPIVKADNADGYADAIEGTLNLYNRVPIPSVKEWLDSEIRVLWAFQKPEGIIEGWHGDGNFARTTLMYCLWKTQGIVPAPWDEQLNIGAVDDNGKLKIAITCKTGWEGLLKFDLPRYKVLMHYPTDYPRINQFQQWFTIDASKKYKVKTANLKPKTVDGVELIKGLPVKVAPGEAVYLTVSKGKDLILEGRRKNRR
jgi:hypothetical protein